MKNILIVRVSAIGDVIHTFPAVIMLKTIQPSCVIHWIVQKKAASLLHNQPFVDHLIELPDHYLSYNNISTTIKKIRYLNQTKWDAIIDFQGLLKTSLLYTFLQGKKYGFNAQHARSSWTSMFVHKTVSPDWTNIIQKNLALASFVAQDIFKNTTSPSVSSMLPSYKLLVPIKQQTIVTTWLKEHEINNQFVILAPNTTWASKHWPTSHWKTLIHLFQKQHPSIPLVLVGEWFGEQAKQLSAWAQNNTIALSIVPAWDLLTTTYLMQQASLLIAPDTGILHLADFIGAKCIALFGPTQKHKHGPFLYPLNQLHAQQITCKHYYKKNHGNQKSIDDPNNCMYTLAPNNVYDAMIEYLKLDLCKKK